MVFFTQLIYIKEGQQDIFDQFEAVAIPLISKYNGRLLLRLRPNDEAYIEDAIDRPYEIHFGEFETEEDFENFLKDDERKRYLHLKELSIKSSLIIRGRKL